jgi:branched-chain amino acid transport system permease protein
VRRPTRVSSLAWALGCTLAGIAGVLIAPILTLDQTQLTLLVINAYAAAMVGRCAACRSPRSAR